MSETKLVLRHGWYGCDTGCCGTELVLFVDGEERDLRWSFDHAENDAERRVLAEQLRAEFGKEHANTPIEFGDCECRF
jgi:hypothetical protein